MQITTVGLDIAKNVFQVHGIDAAEKVVVRKQLRRGQVMKFFEALPPCLVGMEACATAHYWARELTKLGHEVRLMPAKDVKAYVKRNKNDAADAEAMRSGSAPDHALRAARHPLEQCRTGLCRRRPVSAGSGKPGALERGSRPSAVVWVSALGLHE